jgi:1-acyl-sn-glycerol-3-phosphate acyltransferase
LEGAMAENINKINKRKFVRLERFLPVRFKILSMGHKTELVTKVFSAIGKNIGEEGIFIETIKPENKLWPVLSSENRWLLEIDLPPSAIMLKIAARLAWSRDLRKKKEIGLEFIELSNDQRKAIRSYISDGLKSRQREIKWETKFPFRIERFFYKKLLKGIMPSFARLTKPLVIAGINLWVRKVHGLDNIPKDKGSILVANHCSYCDFLMISAFIRKWIYFLATRKLSRHPIMKYFMYYNYVLFVDRDSPGVSYFKQVIDVLKKGNIAVFFPEGTRSLTGRIQRPKLGFVKLAIVAQVPIVPVCFKGTFEVLPKHKAIPRFKKADIFIGKPIYLKQYYKRYLPKDELQAIADNIMEKIGSMVVYSRVD